MHSHSVVSYSLLCYGLWSTGLLCPRDSPGNKECIAMPSSRGSSWPREQTRVSCGPCISRWMLLPLSHLESRSCRACIISLRLTYFVIGSLYLLSAFSHFPSWPQYLWWFTLFHQSVLCIYVSCCCLDSIYKWDHKIFVFLHLISLSIMHSRFIHVVENVQIFFYDWILFHYVPSYS